MSNRNVVVLGASAKPQRFANKAIRLLMLKGYNVIPVHPILKDVEGLTVVSDLISITYTVDTVTLYIGPERSTLLIQSIVQINPRRVIFNPGTENEKLATSLREANIESVRDCTLIMLNEGRF